MTKEHPILFSTPMVKAILEGRKTMTRRVIKYKGDFSEFDKCPYGQVGAFLWVKETHFLYGRWIKNGFTKTGRQKYTFKGIGQQVKYMDTPPDDEVGWFKRPSIFMPRWASRITLEITNVGVERVQDISPEDCLKEGVETIKFKGYTKSYRDNDGLVGHFAALWDSINAKRGYGYSWASNPYVWVIEFKVVKDE